jgi:hypothetical protein
MNIMRFVSARIFAAALCLAPFAAAMAQPAPAVPPIGAAARTQAGINPNYPNASDAAYGIVNDGQEGLPVLFTTTTSSAQLEISGTYYFQGVTLNDAGTAQLVATLPAGVTFPSTIVPNASNTYSVATHCGANVAQKFSSVSVAGQTVTLTLENGTTPTCSNETPGWFVIWPSAGINSPAATNNGSQYSPANRSLVHGMLAAQIQASPGSNTITVLGPNASLTATQSGTVLTVSAITGRELVVGDVISGTGFTTETISSFSSGTGGTGTYNMSVSQAIGSATAMTATTSDFSAGVDYTQFSNMAQIRSQAVLFDGSGTCGPQHVRVNATLSPTQISVTGLSCAISGASYSQLWWGPMTFATTNAINTFNNTAKSMVGETCDLPNGNAGNTDYTSTISSIADPFHATFAGGNFGAANTVAFGRISCGTDNSGSATAGTGINGLMAATWSGTTKGSSVVYIPAGYSLLYLNPSYQGLGSVKLCTDSIGSAGRLIYAANNEMPIEPADCAPVPNPKISFARTLPPKALPPIAAGGTLTVDLVGDSNCVPGSNTLGEMGSSSEVIREQIQAAYPGRTVKINNRCIGSTTLAMFDVNTPACGSCGGPGIPPSSYLVTVAGWYTNPSATWASYVENDAPDLIVPWFTNDDCTFLWGSWWSVNTQFQSASWNSTAGKSPYVWWITPRPAIMQGNAGYTNNALNVCLNSNAMFMRSAILSGDYPAMNTSGALMGLIDLNVAENVAWTGWDPDQHELRRQLSMGFPNTLPNAGPRFQFPITWSAPVIDYGTGFYWQYAANITTAQFFGSSYYTGIKLPLGGGTLEAPATVGGSSSTVTFAYPGNELDVGYDSGSGNFNYIGYLFKVSATATCSISSGTLTKLVCTTSIAHEGMAYASVEVPGAGSSTCLFTAGSNCFEGQIQSVSADGKTLTFTGAASALSSGSVTIEMWHTFAGAAGTPVVSSASATIASSGTSGLQFFTQEQGHTVKVWANGPSYPDIYSGPVSRFGGPYTPIIDTMTHPATATSENNSFQTMSDGNPIATEDNGSFPTYTPTLDQTEMYGAWYGTPTAQAGISPYGGEGAAHADAIYAEQVMRRLLIQELALQ